MCIVYTHPDQRYSIIQALVVYAVYAHGVLLPFWYQCWLFRTRVDAYMYSCNFDINVNFPGPGWTHSYCCKGALTAINADFLGCTHILSCGNSDINVDFPGPGWTHMLYCCNFDVNVDFPGPGWTHTLYWVLSMQTFLRQGCTQCLFAILMSMLTFQDQDGRTHV